VKKTVVQSGVFFNTNLLAMAEYCTLFSQPQSPSHCGPCSLSYCLHILGVDADQHEVARASGLSWWMRYKRGQDERDLQRAAEVYRIRCRFLAVTRKERGYAFADRLRKHLQRGLPAILLVKDFEHWVAVLGYFPESDTFIIDDPNVRQPLFSRWSEKALLINGWNEADPVKHGEPSQYFALLLSRKDNAPPRWRITPDFLRLCETGSGETAVAMTQDLVEIVRRACNGRYPVRGGEPLTAMLDRHEETIVQSAFHWVEGQRRLTLGDVRRQFRDYRIIAEAAGLRVRRNADVAAIVAQMASLMTSFIWKEGRLSA
jgi:hypothetical protein